MDDNSLYQKVVQIFEYEKKKIESHNNGDFCRMMKIDMYDDCNIETFHFETEAESELAKKLILDFCAENGYNYSHACCDLKGHQIKKKRKYRIKF